MPAKDTSELKERIVAVFRKRGPSLPVHAAKEVEMSILFTSAFLSELLSEKKLKMSNMRIGSSPIYYIPGQESSLENYAEYLKNKERDAYLLLKEKSFLKDLELEPAIRVAIREIKDFAVPINRNGEIWWRYFTINESELKTPISKKEETKKIEIKEPETKIEIVKIEETPKEKTELDIFDKEKEAPIKTSKKTKTTKKKPVSKIAKKNEKFLEKVRDFLSKDHVDISGIEGIKNDELILKIRVNGDEQLLIAFNKKKITEKEIIKAAKKATEYNMKYSILSLGELPKKISDLIEALQNIKNIGKVE